MIGKGRQEVILPPLAASLSYDEIGQTMNRKMMRLAIEGQGLVEYALILLLVAMVCVAALTALGATLPGIYTTIAGAL